MGFAGQIIPPKHGKRRHGRDGGFEHFHALGRGLRLRIEGNQGQMGLAPHEHRQPRRRLGHQEELEFLELRRHPPVGVGDAFQYERLPQHAFLKLIGTCPDHLAVQALLAFGIKVGFTHDCVIPPSAQLDMEIGARLRQAKDELVVVDHLDMVQ